MRRRIAPLGLGLALLVVLVFLARPHLGELHRLSDVSLATIAGIALLYVAARAVGGEVMRVALAPFGHRISRSECFRLAFVISYSNLLLPRSGLAPAAVYLKQRHGVTYTRHLSQAVVTTILGTGVIGAVGCAVQLQQAALRGAPLRSDALVIFAGLALAAAASLHAPNAVLARLPGRLRDRLRGPREAWLALTGRPRLLARLGALQLAGIGLRALRLQLALAAAGVEAPPAGVLLASLLADIGMLISLTPAALGFREGAIVYGALWMGVAPSAAILAGVLDRLVWTGVVMLLGPLFVWRLLRRGGAGEGAGSSGSRGGDRGAGR